MPTSDKHDTIASVQQAIDWLNKIKGLDSINESIRNRGPFPFGVWFRGHENRAYVLEPKAFRRCTADKSTDAAGAPCYPDETNHYQHARVRMAPIFEPHQTLFDVLCHMQHYDICTRLLDWSESILVALYFAVRDAAVPGQARATTAGDIDGEVIMLDARRLCKRAKGIWNISDPWGPDVTARAAMADSRSWSTFRRNHPDLSILPETSATNLDHPVAVIPNRFNVRMVFQSSVFTLHGGKCYGDDSEVVDADRLPGPKSLETLERDPDGARILIRATVPGDAKRHIASQLFEVGIHEGSLFPEMDKQAVYLKRLWR